MVLQAGCIQERLCMCVLQIFSYSSFNREGEVGESTAAALEAKGAHWVKVKPPRVKPPSKQYGVPAQPGPDLGIEYRCGTTAFAVQTKHLYTLCSSACTLIQEPRQVL